MLCNQQFNGIDTHYRVTVSEISLDLVITNNHTRPDQVKIYRFVEEQNTIWNFEEIKNSGKSKKNSKIEDEFKSVSKIN